MKKLLFGAAALLLMASCSGNTTKEKAKEDSIRIADSIAQVEAAKAAAEQARMDSIRQDSINNATAGLTFQMFCKPEKVEGVNLQSFLSLKQITANLEKIDFSLTKTQKKKDKDYDWTPDNPTYYTKTITTFAKPIGNNITTVKLEGADGYVSKAIIEFPKPDDVSEFKGTVKGKLKDTDIYWHEMYIKYKGNTVEIEAGGGE